MNISTEAIPQIFYDFIARILPGFFFLAFIFFILYDVFPLELKAYPVSIEVKEELTSKDTSLTVVSEKVKTTTTIMKKDYFLFDLFKTFGFIFIPYFIGTMLSGIYRIFGKEHPSFSNEDGKDSKFNYDSPGFYIQYQRIKLFFPEVAFRIVKLRAEARMMEATLVAICLSIIISLILIVIMEVKDSQHPCFPDTAHIWFFVLRIVSLILITRPVIVLKNKYIHRYELQVSRCYQIIFNLDKSHFIGKLSKDTDQKLP